ncbi:torsin-1A-like [Macrosteles quadrilineatus]|uniref:torsin-1A-like n=1 Tax=Macrosteles quadrilineatus TaxID=74068 RepID=UPI0023E22A70|nr:torsin-1A-like [Macrosteles quadrilineatus]
MKLHYIFHVFISVFHVSSGFSVFDILSPVVSLYAEQCDSRWVTCNITGLEKVLYEKVFGQDLAVRVILTALKNHLSKTNHKKPLVLSFHGWPGGGKTFVKDFILEHWFREGQRSKFVKTYFALKDFPSNDKVKVDEYKMRLQEDLQEKISLCQRSIFVFDEVDKYPPYVLDAIKPYIDYNTHIDGYDYRKAIFIFMTNIGGPLISQISLQKWLKGIDREDFKLSDFEQPIRKHSFNCEGGFYQSDLIRHHLIDYIVPFLPLERPHVKLCIETVFREKGKVPDHVLDQTVKEILEELTFNPPEHHLYAYEGCRHIHSRVDFTIEEIQRQERKNHYSRGKNEL